MLVPTFIENPEHVNAATSQYGESMEEQPQYENTRLDAEMAFMDDYPWKTSKLLDRETPGGNKDIP